MVLSLAARTQGMLTPAKAEVAATALPRARNSRRERLWFLSGTQAGPWFREGCFRFGLLGLLLVQRDVPAQMHFEAKLGQHGGFDAAGAVGLFGGRDRKRT